MNNLVKVVVGMALLLVLLLLLVIAIWPPVTSAFAQEPTEQQKKAALMEAWRMNGDSMVRWGSIDMTGMINGADVEDARPVRVVPIAPPPEKNALDAIADMTNPDPAPHKQRDICKVHGLRKVITKGGGSWRCKR